MSKPLTLGSLFSGSGGFELGGVLCGIEPLWASEVEPFPIRVTTKRLPQVRHLGDINKIDGAAIPPVDVITGGFCCQDLSVAGKRAGLHGERSGLFFQVVRIIKEMLAATHGEYPKFAVLENVPGMYSSAGGADFLEVLNELIHINDESAEAHPRLHVPLPEKGKWSTSGEILGDGFSLGWRTFDAQFWGVAQRRRRCYIVLDFTGERAGKVLFDESRLRGNPPAGGFPWQSSAGSAADGTGGAVAFEPGACSRLGGHYFKGGPVGTLRADMGDNQTAVVIPINTQVGLRNQRDGDGTGLGVGEEGSPAYTLQAAHAHAVAVGNHPAIAFAQNQRDEVRDLRDCAGTLAASLGMKQQTYVLQGSMIGRADKNGPHGDGVNENVSFTLTGQDRHGVAYAMTAGCFTQVYEEKAPTLQARDYKDAPLVSRPQYIIRRILPSECALLQGFPSDWCAGLETPDPSEEDIAFWSEVWETHRHIIRKSSKPRSRKQIVKWLKAPHSDAAEYKMWGNGVALPCVAFVLGGIVAYTQA